MKRLVFLLMFLAASIASLQRADGQVSVPLRHITINGVTQDLGADRSWMTVTDSFYYATRHWVDSLLLAYTGGGSVALDDTAAAIRVGLNGAASIAALLDTAGAHMALINGKVNYADTAAMLAGYARELAFLDSIAGMRDSINALRAAVTAAATGGSVTDLMTDATMTGGPITTTGTLGVNVAHGFYWSGLDTAVNMRIDSVCTLIGKLNTDSVQIGRVLPAANGEGMIAHSGNYYVEAVADEYEAALLAGTVNNTGNAELHAGYLSLSNGSHAMALVMPVTLGATRWDTLPNATGTIFIRPDTVGGSGDDPCIATGTLVKDSAMAIQGRIALKMNYTDTAAMLAGYARLLALIDTAAAIRTGLSGAASIAALLDTAAAHMTLIQARVKYTDTAAMLAGYARLLALIDTAAAIRTGLAAAGTGTVTSVTAGVGISVTGSATINPTVNVTPIPAHSVLSNNTGSSTNPAGSIAYDSAATATALVEYNYATNVAANNIAVGFQSFGANKKLSLASPFIEENTYGGGGSVDTLPVASTLPNGMTYFWINNGAGYYDIVSSGGIGVHPGSIGVGCGAFTTCVNNAGGTGAASWQTSFTCPAPFGAIPGSARAILYYNNSSNYIQFLTSAANQILQGTNSGDMSFTGTPTCTKWNMVTGSNTGIGTATLSSGTVTVSNTQVTANSKIEVWLNSGATPSTVTSIYVVTTLTAGTSFVITAYTPGTAATATTDNNVVYYKITN